MKSLLELLQPGYTTDKTHGFYAEIENGQLKHFGYYLNGRPVGTYLTLDETERRGRVETTESWYPEDPYDGDEVLPPEQLQADEELFWEWAETWIHDVYAQREERSQPLRCSFCGKTQDEVRKLVAGPDVYICNECIELCAEIAEDSGPERPRSSSWVPTGVRWSDRVHQPVWQWFRRDAATVHYWQVEKVEGGSLLVQQGEVGYPAAARPAPGDDLDAELERARQAGFAPWHEELLPPLLVQWPIPTGSTDGLMKTVSDSLLAVGGGIVKGGESSDHRTRITCRTVEPGLVLARVVDALQRAGQIEGVVMAGADGQGGFHTLWPAPYHRPFSL